MGLNRRMEALYNIGRQGFVSYQTTVALDPTSPDVVRGVAPIALASLKSNYGI